MENAAKPAVEDLVVRVWGMNAKGKPFSQSAYARNLTLDGALLSGVDDALAPGRHNWGTASGQEGAIHSCNDTERGIAG